ncbi:MAG: ATP-binding protein [Dysgonamonadaceae bacterium]|jgi:hypothetical protein|nr:ATP-binding protein [Dysgonamonadaceae bacterium]
MKKLPIGIQDFERLRTEEFLYVDKTKYIYDLLHSGSYYFLSRPRRFGKSLLLSTLKALFEGKKDLFKGLYIHDKHDWMPHPVIHFSWGNIEHSTAESMEISTANRFDTLAEEYDITLTNIYASQKFDELIKKIYKKTGKKVVVLVDEYDMPILDALDNSKVLEEIRGKSQGIYKILKDSGEYIRFVLLTGVSKFSKVSIFSGLNNLNDITLDKKYAGICGYTQEELETSFSEHIAHFSEIEKTDKKQIIDSIKKWYNGYSWDGETMVYNPFSTLLLFDKNQFSNFWFSTGTPTFLINLIKEQRAEKNLLEPITIPMSNFESADPVNMDVASLLFQTGYLTVKSITKNMFSDMPDYTLGIPNNEVQDSIMAHLFASYAGHSLSDATQIRDKVKKQLLEGDERGFAQSLRETFAHIPYQLHIKQERYYHSILLIWLKMLGFETYGEVSTDKGRIDAVWTWRDHAFVMEIKQTNEKNAASPLQEAMNQIKEKRYYDRYDGYKITLVAVAFTHKEIECKFEVI